MAEASAEAAKRLNLSDHVVGSISTIIYIPDFVDLPEQAQLLHHIYQAPAPKWKTLKNRRLQNWGGVVHEKGLVPQDLPSWLTKVTQKISEATGLFPSDINHVLVNEYLPEQGIMPHQDGPAYFPVVAILSLGAPVVIDFTPHQKLKVPSFCGASAAESVDTYATSEAKICGDGLCSELLKEKKDEHPHLSVVLMPGSLLIFKDQAYSDYLHGIKDSPVHNLEKVVNMSQCSELWKDTSAIEHDGANWRGDTEHSNLYRRTSSRVSLTCRLVLKAHKNLFRF